MRNSFFIIIISATMAAAGCSSKAADETKENTSTAQALPVDIVIATLTSIQQSENLAGSILPNREVEIMSELTKKIKYVAFADGSMVVKGQLLYKLGDEDILAKMQQMEAELSLARINEKRMRALLETETIRQEEYDIALAKKLNLEAAADLLRSDYSKTFIKAPFSGRVGISKLQAGALVSPGISLVTLQEQDKVRISFSVSEKYLPRVKKGSTIQFSTALTPIAQAIVIATEPGVDIKTRNISVQAIAENFSAHLKPGMSARIEFNTRDENTKNLWIPARAFIPGTNGYSVFVVKNGVAKSTSVTLGDRNEEEAMVTSGIQQGDTIMISNILRAMDGIPVQIINNASK